MAAFIDNKIVSKFLKCTIKVITSGNKRGKDILSLNSIGNIKLASIISRDKFLNNLKKSLV